MTDSLLNKVGVLISNLGTPDAPTAAAVRKYLAEFLWDPLIVQIPRPVWWLLLHGIVLRIRPQKSAKLYQKIWTPSGSPLLVLTQELMNKLRTLTTEQGYQCEYALGMRYGNPSIQQALRTLKELGITHLVLLPLYPQFSTTTTLSTFQEVEQQLKTLNWHPTMSSIDSYAKHSAYISALAQTIHSHWQKQTPGQKLIFSFHGIPKKNILKGDPYYEQCHYTATQVATLLNLPEEKWEMVFQSRFGREEWLQPYCHEVLQRLPPAGYKHIDIICPGFAVECLETLEEIAITNKKIFHEAGGVTYHYIPALNDSVAHVQLLSTILIQHLQEFNTSRT